MRSQTWTSRPELHSILACPVRLDPLACPYPPTSLSSFPSEPAPVFVYTNFRRIPPMHQKVLPFNTVWRPFAWIAHRHLWYPQPRRRPNPNGKKNKLEGVLAECYEVNGSCRGRRHPPGCFRAGVWGQSDAKERGRRGRRGWGWSIREKTIGRGTLGGGV